MERAEFIHAVRARVAFEDDADAEAAIVATLDVLGARLFENDARVVADQLPNPWASSLRRRGPEEEFDLEELYRRVAAARGLALGPAVEQTQVVCQVLAERVDEDGRAHLHLRLPTAIRELFTPRPAPPPAPDRVGAPVPHAGEPPRPTLAGGRPGSRNPLSEGKPTGGQSHSLAANPDPHRDTKLAAARGISTERDGENLASASPDTDRTLASRDED